MGNCCPQKDDTISFSTSFSFSSSSSSSSSSFTPSFPSFPSIIRQSSNEDTIDFDAIIADYHRRHPKPDVKLEVKQEDIPLPPIKRQNCVYNIA